MYYCVSLHPGCSALIYVAHIVNVLHDKSDVSFPFETQSDTKSRSVSSQRIFDIIYEEWKLIELELSVDPFV